MSDQHNCPYTGPPIRGQNAGPCILMFLLTPEGSPLRVTVARRGFLETDKYFTIATCSHVDPGGTGRRIQCLPDCLCKLPSPPGHRQNKSSNTLMREYCCSFFNFVSQGR